MVVQYRVKDKNGNFLSLTSGQPQWVQNIIQANLFSSEQVQDWVRSGYDVIPVYPQTDPSFNTWEEATHNQFPLNVGMKGDLVRDFQHWLRVKFGMFHDVQETSHYDKKTYIAAVQVLGSPVVTREMYESFMKQL